jgi:hypothetical protein
MDTSPQLGMLTVAPLTPDMFRTAYPLVRDAVPELDLTDWLRFARYAASPARRNQGILVAWRRRQPFPCGLCCWKNGRDLDHGQVLTAEHVIAVDILDPASLVDALLRELEVIAARLGCRALRSVVRPNSPVLSTRLLAGGHEPAARLFQKGLSKPLPT